MNILTFDIEEWFHILDNKETKVEHNWLNFESRIHKNMDIIFEILYESKVKATFFVVGWIANRYPDIVKKITQLGYEIGSHSHLHQLVYQQNRQIFFNDTEKSIKTLEDISGKKVTIFRAPGFSITQQNKWAFEVLHELGIEIDASVFPASRAHGGFPTFKESEPSFIHFNGVKLKEFPINTCDFFGRSIIFSGGGYFRLLPYSLIKNLTKKSDYTMTYFHPRDFDFRQPIVPGLSLTRRFKSYVGIKNCKFKLERWLNDFDFIDLKTANKEINWDKVPNIKL
tara:strand:- start:1786 stop:2634 length:849 start_codon:yes stop_codon:yes gene_type:complete